MNIEIIHFPETKLAAIEYQGPPELEHQAIKRLIDWRIENRFPPSAKHRNYGLHYNDPRKVRPEDYRIDIGISVDEEIAPNAYGVINKIIPACRCVKARHWGSRNRVTAAEYLYDRWLPVSGEKMADLPIIFHYVNVGPLIQEHEMITDVYLPLA